MAIKIYGNPASTCTQRVALAFAEKDVEFEIVAIDVFKGEQKQAANLARMPFGKIPILEDDGYQLYESRAIAKYVAQKFPAQGNKVMPDVSDLKAYGRFESACSMEYCYFEGPASGIAYEKAFKAFRGLGGPDEEIVARHVAALDSALGVYDKILSGQAYLAGDQATLADLFHLPYGRFVKQVGHGDLFDKYPNVARWWAALEARDSSKKVFAA